MTDVFKFIFSKRGKYFTKQQEKFIKFLTVYTRDGKAVDFGVTAKPERMKKARRLGLCERNLWHMDEPTPIANPFRFDIQRGSFMLTYRPDTRAFDVFKLH